MDFLRVLLDITTGNYMLIVNNRNTRTKYEICSKFTIKTLEHISHLALVFLLSTLSW